MRDDVSYIDAYSNVLAQASSASELCRKLVHSDLTTPSAIGASIYAIDQQAHINLVGSYGKGLPASGVTVWDEHPFGRAARQGKLHSEEVEAIDGSPVSAYCLPLLKGDEPIGLLVLTLMPGQPMHKISGDALSAISRITAIWLDGLSLGSAVPAQAGKSPTTPSPESLTERQLAVLRLMAEGKTNAEIAQEMILSESTIRQETVRIYRALGVSARADASKRAKHLGIIDRLAI
jgi:DNA-binding CsgD family transcriptional regulator